MPALTPKQTKWFFSHFKHTKNDDICAKLGISASYLHRLAREYGLTKTRQFMAKMQANATALAKIAIANEDEAAKERRRQQANKNRNPDRCFKPGVYSLEGKTAEERAAINEKRRQSWLKTRRDDETRLDWGLPQETNFHFSRHPDPDKNQRLCKLRSYMRRKGYRIDGKGGMKAIITPDTRRSERSEREAKKLGMLVVL